MNQLHQKFYRLFSQLRFRSDKYWYALKETWANEGRNESNTNIASLESRILFSATPIAELAQAAESQENLPSETQPSTAEKEVQKQATAVQLVFVDDGLNDPEALIELIRSGGQDPIEIVLIDSDRSGIEQMTETLSGREDIGAVHILSHGTERGFGLGSEFVTDSTLDGYASSISQWREALNQDADISIYGCDLASSAEGRQLIDSLSELSDADVAASDDLTGHHDLGGDWQLEYSTGLIETGVILSGEAQQNFRELLPNTPPSITVSGSSSVVLGSTYQLHLSLTDVDNDTIIQWRVDWGDGSADVFSGNNSSLTVSHVYTNEGFRDILVSVQDSTGTYSNSQAVLSSQDTNELQFFDSNGNFLLSQSGAIFDGPESVLKGPDGLLYVSSFHDGTVKRYELNGTFVDTFYDTGPGNGANQMAFDARGNLYVTNFGADEIHKIDRFGNGSVFISTVDSPTGLQIGPDNLLYVSTFGNKSVLRFDLDSGTQGRYDSGVTIDLAGNMAFGPSGELYVVDQHNKVVVVLDNTGAFERTISHPSIQTGGNIVRGVAVGPDGNIYITSADNNNGNSSNNSTVEIFRPDGTHLGQFVDVPELRNPYAVYFTPALQVSVVSPVLDTVSETLVNQDDPAHPLVDSQHTGQDDRFSSSAVSMAASGHYVVVFTHEFSDGTSDVFFQLYNPNGTKIGTQQRVNTTTADDQHSASVAMNDSRDFVVTWVSENQDGTSSSIFARRYNADGTAKGGEFLVNNDNSGFTRDQPGSQQNPDVSINNSGRFVISWDGEGQIDGIVENHAVFFKVYNSDGTVRHGTKKGNNIFTDFGGEQQNAAIAIDKNGGVAMAWEDEGRLKGRFYNSDGSS